MIRALLLTATLLAAPALAQQSQASPPGGDPAVQAPVPEVGAGRSGSPAAPAAGGAVGPGAAQVPASTEPQTPTGVATAPPPAAVAPTPAPPMPTRQPFTDRNQLSAAELELQAALKGERISGRITIPDQRAANLIQPEGRDWRAFHNYTLTWIGGVALGGILCILLGFFLYRGRIQIEAGWAGRTIERFSVLERTTHWMVAGSFIVLGLTGLNLTFGRHLLLPLVGPEAFTAIATAGKYAHNYLAFPFTLGIVLMFILWVRDNIPEKADIEWLKQAGGLFGHGHPGAGRFNAGQKSVFWMTVGGGSVVALSGYVLIFPFTVTDITGQQLAYVIHGVLSLLMFAAMLAHIYIGSVGMQGAFAAMGTGQVDYNWAKEHHDRWVAEEMQKARQVAAPPGAKAAGAD